MAQVNPGTASSVAGQDTLSYLNAFGPATVLRVRAQRAPTVNDRRYKIGTIWINESTNSSWQLTSVVTNSATWTALGGGATAVSQLSGDTGTATPTAGNINITGTANELETAASGSNLAVRFVSNVIFSAGPVSVSRSAVGVTNTLTVENTNNASPTASAALRAIAGGASGGDAFTQYTVSGVTNVVVGLDNDDGDNFVMSNDTAVGTNNFFRFFQVDSSIAFEAGNVRVTRSAAADIVELQSANEASGATAEAAVRITTDTADAYVYFEHDGPSINWSCGSQITTDAFVIAEDLGLTNNVYVSVANTSGDVDITTGNLSISGAARQLQVEGGAVTDFIGQATLVAGTVTVANTNIAATDKIFVQREGVAASTALGVLDVSISAGASFTITALQPATPGSTETNDVSIVNYFIVRQL